MQSSVLTSLALQSPTFSGLTESAGQQPSANGAAREFEGLFLSMVLKELRGSLGEGSLFGGDSSDIYGGLFDLMLSQSLATTQPLGIARLLQSSLRAAGNAPLAIETSPEAPTTGSSSPLDILT